MTSVGIDCRFASGVGGLGTYTRELVTALLKNERSWQATLFVANQNESWLNGIPAGVRIVPVTFPHYSLAEQLGFPAVLRRSGVDLLFVPHFSAPFRCPVPFVCTVHDLILHRYPNQASVFKRFVYRFLFSSSVRRARHIICVSESTRNDLMKQERSIDPEKIFVIYPGVAETFSPRPAIEQQTVSARYGLSERYLLYVGNAKQHKNVQMLIDAFASVDDGLTSLILVCSGKEAEALRLKARVRIISDVSQADLPALYSAAAGCVTATLYEGFGLPLIEALACGCPVMATNVASIPEVCGGLAILVEPTVPSLSAGLVTLLASTKRPILSHALRERYDWHRSAEQLQSILESCLIESPSHG